MLKIIPDEIPEETSYVGETDIAPQKVADVRSLDGKNVFIELHNRKTLVGRMECHGNVLFTVGTDDEHYLLYDIKTLRET
jgi:hypothetical protein